MKALEELETKYYGEKGTKSRNEYDQSMLITEKIFMLQMSKQILCRARMSKVFHAHAIKLIDAEIKKLKK